jgi:methanethiol S-methyltransferase
MATLILLWLVFGISHSLLAATNVRAYFEKLSHNNPHYFRLLYNLIALILLYLIVEKTIELNTPILNLNNYFLIKLIGSALILSSFYVLFGVAKQMDLLAFFGFKKEEITEGLMTNGWYRIVRHPLYFGLFLLFLGVFCLIPTVGVAISVVFSKLYILIGIEFEEKKLRRVFGDKYLDFSKDKKKFIPFIY